MHWGSDKVGMDAGKCAWLVSLIVASINFLETEQLVPSEMKHLAENACLN